MHAKHQHDVRIYFQVDLNQLKAISFLKNRGQSGSVNYPSWRGQTMSMYCTFEGFALQDQCVVWAGNVGTPCNT